MIKSTNFLYYFLFSYIVLTVNIIDWNIIFPHNNNNNHVVTAALEAQWTPATDETSEPLPLSQKQRNELMQLDQAIQNSPDPEGTLQKVAQANGMDPNELMNILISNRKSAEMAAGDSGSNYYYGRSRLGAVMQFFGVVSVHLVHYAKKYPHRFSMMTSILFLVFYILWNKPRNGCVLPAVGSRRLSTLYEPPREFVGAFLGSLKASRGESRKEVIGCSRVFGNLVNDFDEDGVTFGQKKSRVDGVKFSVTARTPVDFDSCASAVDAVEEDESEDEIAYISEIAYESALSILNSRRFSEYTTTSQMRFQGANSSSLNAVAKRKLSGGMGGTGAECAALVMKKLAFRWGVQPLKLSYEEDFGVGVTSKALGYHTLKGAHFDGEIRISVDRIMLKEEDDSASDTDSLIVSVTFVVPKKGRKMKKKLAQKLVSSLAASIATSITSETRKKIARQPQSKNYRSKVSSFAKERRTLKAINNQKLEEMAEDRKRRWKRKGEGRYRPSGRRIEGSPRFGS